MKKAISTLAIVGILGFFNPALAQNAAELREDVDWVVKSIAKDSDNSVVLESDEPRNETVNGAPAVVLPKAAFVIKDFGRIELGAVRAVAEPAPAGLRRVSFLLPSGAELRDEGGETTHTLTAATAKLTVDFPPTRQRVRGASLTIKDAEIGEAQGPGRLAIKSAVATSDMKPAQGELWTGITAIDVDGVVVSPGGPQARASIDKLTVRQETNDMRIEALEALGASLATLLPKNEDEPIDHDALLRELTAAISQHGTLFSGFKQTLQVGGVKIVDPDSDVDMRMTGFVLEQEMRGFDKGLIDWRLAGEYAGLDVAQAMIDPGLFLNGLGIDITLKNIPGGEILGILKSSFDRTAPGETDDMLPQQVQGALIAAKPSLQLTRLALVTQKLTGQAAGRFAFDPQAMMMGEGEALVTFRGLAELARDIRAGKGNVDPMSAEIVTTLNKLAKPGKGADGKPVQEMRVKLGKDGNVLVNGKDLASQLAPEQPQQRQRRP